MCTQLGSAFTIGNIFLMLAFITLPMGMYLIMVFGDLPGDVVDASTLLLQTQTTWDALVYTCCFFFVGIIAANIIRMLVAVYTDYEIALWITREVYKQNVDDERTARRYDRDRQALAAYKEAQEVTRHTTGVQELVEEVFTQATTDGDAGKTHDDVPDADKQKDSSKKLKKSLKSHKSHKSHKSKKANNLNKSSKSNKSKKNLNKSKKAIPSKKAMSPAKPAPKHMPPHTNHGQSMVASLVVDNTQNDSIKTPAHTTAEAKTQSLSLSLNPTQRD